MGRQGRLLSWGGRSLRVVRYYSERASISCRSEARGCAGEAGILTASQRAKLCDEAGANLRRDVSAQLLPALQRFDVDLVIFSAGFDGYEADLYHWFRESDYEWLTHAVLDASPRLLAFRSWKAGTARGTGRPRRRNAPGHVGRRRPIKILRSKAGAAAACAAHVSALAARAPPRRRRGDSDEFLSKFTGCLQHGLDPYRV